MMAMATSSRSRLRMEQYQAGQKERGARQPHKRLLYCVNVNRTSLDHLLLGRNADVDMSVEWADYNAGSGRCQNKEPPPPCLVTCHPACPERSGGIMAGSILAPLTGITTPPPAPSSLELLHS